MNDTISVNPGLLTREQVSRICTAAGILLPGSSESPSPGSLPEFPDLVQRAAKTLNRELPALEKAIAALPSEMTWDTLSAYSTEEAESFELVSLVVVGAYYMSPTVLAALGLPTGERRRAPLELAVDQLDGILDAVLERGCPVKTLEDIDECAKAGDQS